MLFAITAPIRLPSKTAPAIEREIRTLLRRESPGRDAEYTIHGNRVQIRLLANRFATAPTAIGFVHDAGSDPRLILNLTQDLLDLIGAQIDKRTTRRRERRWLVIANTGNASYVEAYRHIHSEFPPAGHLEKILLVFPAGRVDMLTDRLPVVIPPRSAFRLVRADERTPAWKADVGRVFRIGYYSQQDGLDCLRLVNERREYVGYTDRGFLVRYFEQVKISRETDMFGAHKPKLRPIKRQR